MPTSKERLEELFTNLRQLRDELALKIHLGKAEAKEEWQKLEDKWGEVSGRREALKEALGDSAKSLGSALDLLADELKRGYERIRKLL